MEHDPRPTAPWWRHGMVWLVIGGPALVIVAGFATLAIAIANPDPVLPSRAAATAADAPAVQGRNHAATPR
jgi:uncharacterized protein